MLASAMTFTSWALVGLAACAFIATAAAVYFILRSGHGPAPAVEGNDLRYMLDAVRRSEHEKDMLAESLRVAHEAVLRRKRFERIAEKLDLDSVLERAFEAAREVLQVDAAA